MQTFIDRGETRLIYGRKPRYIADIDEQSIENPSGSDVSFYSIGEQHLLYEQTIEVTKLLKADTCDCIDGRSILGFDLYTAGNMCHVLYDHIQRYHAASQQDIDFDHFILTDKCWDWVKSAINDVLKIQSKITYIKDWQVYKINNLLVDSGYPRPSHPAFNCEIGYLEFLQNSFHEYSNAIQATNRINLDKVFVSRRNATRKPSNHTQVEDLFKSFGFSVVYFEDLNFDQQVSCCFNAKFIAGYHGAGLTNLISSRKNVQVLEIFTGRGSLSYRKVCLALGLAYSSFGVRGRKRAPIANVDISSLREKLKVFLN